MWKRNHNPKSGNYYITNDYEFIAENVSKGNINKIVAAPEMYEALNELTAFVTNVDNRICLNRICLYEDLDHLVKKARKALAKAEGCNEK